MELQASPTALPSADDSSDALSGALAGLQPRADDAAALMRLLGNPHRLLILCALVEGELPVSVLQARVGLSQSALSQHLARLRRADVVVTRRSAQQIYYALPPGPVTALMGTLYRVYCGAGR